MNFSLKLCLFLPISELGAKNQPGGSMLPKIGDALSKIIKPIIVSTGKATDTNMDKQETPQNLDQNTEDGSKKEPIATAPPEESGSEEKKGEPMTPVEALKKDQGSFIDLTSHLREGREKISSASGKISYQEDTKKQKRTGRIRKGALYNKKVS